MARKVRGFERVLDAPALFAIAYGEIGSSIYVALGIVAASALGLTPVVLAFTGIVFGLVALSYAEGTAAIPETGGAETFTRRAFNDLVGIRHRLGALPRLPDRHRALRAVRAALRRRRARGGEPEGLALGHRRRRLRDRAHRRVPPRAALAAAPAGARRRAARPRRAVGHRAARPRAPVLALDARRGARPRAGTDLARRPPVRDPARLPRLHGPRDGREPRGRGPRAGAHAAAVALLRDRPRRDPDRARRGRRRDRVPGRGRVVRARRAVARGAARGHRHRVRRRAAGERRRRCSGSQSGSRRRSSS